MRGNYFLLANVKDQPLMFWAVGLCLYVCVYACMYVYDCYRHKSRTKSSRKIQFNSLNRYHVGILLETF